MKQIYFLLFGLLAFASLVVVINKLYSNRFDNLSSENAISEPMPATNNAVPQASLELKENTFHANTLSQYYERLPTPDRSQFIQTFLIGAASAMGFGYAIALMHPRSASKFLKTLGVYPPYTGLHFIRDIFFYSLIVGILAVIGLFSLLTFLTIMT